MKHFYFLICLILVACESVPENTTNMNHALFKILTPEQWETFQKEKVFQGSELDQKDDFIHLSLPHQWNKTWQKFFNNAECYLIEINQAQLKPDLLKIEANRPGAEQYPHYYGNLMLDAVVRFELLQK